MGQTLTHGIYLPDEGERNCYNGLAGNWQLLDGAVGTIAEHTTALSGKAPLVHTHGKADITDLFNSANVWTGDNTYSKTVAIERSTDTGNFLALKNTVAELGSTPASATPVTIAYRDKNNNNLGYIGMFYDTDGSNNFRLFVRNKFTSGTPSTSGTVDYTTFQLRLNADKSKEGILKALFRPYDNNTYDLGSSSYQWNNLYAKNYYYNGTAWGLDKSNRWGNTQTVTGNDKGWNIINPDLEKGVIPSANKSSFVWWADKNNNFLGRICSRVHTDGTTMLWLSSLNYYKNGALDPTGSSATTSLILGVDANAYKFVQTNADFIPDVNNVYSLGTSTNKWKTLWANGINSVPTDTVEWHNSHYRGINLISDGHFANMAALLTAIRNQDWSDIYIGDYVELTFTYEGASRTVKFYVGEIDKFYKVGDASLETHHLVMVTGDLGINQVMNDSNTTAGGYVGSKAHTVTLPALYAILNPLFNNAILTHKEHLSNAVLSAQTVSLSLDDGNGAVTYSCNNFPVYSSGDPNTPGCVTAGNWYDCNLVLMSEIEMFGSNRFASSGIDDIMCPEGQIAAFKYNRNLQTLNRTINTWLRNVNSASRFCLCHGSSNSYRFAASNSGFRLRPRFLIG